MLLPFLAYVINERETQGKTIEKASRLHCCKFKQEFNLEACQQTPVPHLPPSPTLYDKRQRSFRIKWQHDVRGIINLTLYARLLGSLKGLFAPSFD